MSDHDTTRCAVMYCEECAYMKRIGELETQIATSSFDEVQRLRTRITELEKAQPMRLKEMQSQLNQAKLDNKGLLGSCEKLERRRRDELTEKEHILSLLRDTKMKHGLCQPRERKACTACGAKEHLDEILSKWKGVTIYPTSKRIEEGRCPKCGGDDFAQVDTERFCRTCTSEETTP